MFKKQDGTFAFGRLAAVIIVLVLLISVSTSCFTTVPAGHTGVVLTFGSVGDTVLQEGLHFKIPFIQNVVVIDNRIVKLEVATEAFSKDLQTISSNVAVNYHIAKDKSADMYKNVGLSFEEVLIAPTVNEVLKAVTAKYTAVELVSTRSEVSVLLDEGLNEKLNGYGIYIDELNVIDWDFSAEYISAIEAKQVAEQNLIKTRTEQEQALVIANTEAEKRVIAAQAEADEIKLLAEANAESNNILTESLSELLIKYQSLQRWDGKLPLVTGESTPMVDVSSLAGEAAE